MADIVIYKGPGVSLSGDRAATWEDLAARLRNLDHNVRREDRYMEPGRVGVIFGEAVVIYLGVKAVDVLTDHAIEALFERIFNTVRNWGRERFGQRKDLPRPSPTSVAILDEDGKVIKSWRIDQNGEQEMTPDADMAQLSRPVVNVHEPAPTAWDSIPSGREPQILLLLRLTHEETHLRVDVFVGREHRVVADLTRMPGHVEVSPTPGRLVKFVVAETDSDLVFEVSADGYRCEATQIGGDLLVFCYEVE